MYFMYTKIKHELLYLSKKNIFPYTVSNYKLMNVVKIILMFSIFKELKKHLEYISYVYLDLNQTPRFS